MEKQGAKRKIPVVVRCDLRSAPAAAPRCPCRPHSPASISSNCNPLSHSLIPSPRRHCSPPPYQCGPHGLILNTIMAAPPSMVRRLAEALLAIVLEVSAAAGRSRSARLARRIGLLAHLVEEVRDFAARKDGDVAPESTSSGTPAASCLADLLLALQAARRVLVIAHRAVPENADTDLVNKNAALQLQYVTWQLEKALGSLPYEYFEISEEVQEEVELVRVQLRRETEKNGIPNLNLFREMYHIFSWAHSKEVKQQIARSGESQVEKACNPDPDLQDMVMLVAEINGKCKADAEKIASKVTERLGQTGFADPSRDSEAEEKPSNFAKKTLDRSETFVIPEDYRCPISLELMKDPVIVSTGQTYERSFIQRWIDSGKRTCPKTQQKLQHITLTPNYVLRSLVMQWCETNKVDQPCCLTSGRARKCDGSFHEVTGERAALSALIHNLSSSSLEEKRSAAAEIRLMAKRSTENRILITEAGAIPSLVNLLSADDPKTQEHAVTALLNLSIYDSNKEVIMLSGAIIPIVEVLRKGSMEARENAAAAIFSLSLNDENKVTIGSTSGAIESLVELLLSGSSRGKKDAATALFNLCIYQGNKARAVRAGILTPLLQMLKDPSSNGMVDEALTILSVLVVHQEGKVAAVQANTIPLLIDLLRTGQPRNRENAAAILLTICKKDAKNLAYIGRLGALIPLTELAKSGTERAKGKAIFLLNHLSKLQTI